MSTELLTEVFEVLFREVAKVQLETGFPEIGFHFGMQLDFQFQEVQVEICVQIMS